MKSKSLPLMPLTALIIEACSSSQEAVTPKDIGSLSAESKKDTLVAEKDTSKIKRDFLLPLSPFYDALSNGTTLTQWAPIVDGPINLNLKRISGEDGFLEYAKLDSAFIRHFEKANPYLKTNKGKSQFRDLLSQYKLFPRELAHVFKDGKILSEEELNLINNMPEGEYIFQFYYKSSNYNNKVPRDKKESVPGIIRVIKRKNNFDYDFLIKVKELSEGKEDKIKKDESKRDSLGIQDSSYCELDTLKQDFMDIGFGYDSDNMFNLDARFRVGKNLSIGPRLGIGLEDEENLWIYTPHFIGDGSEAMQNYYLGVSAGINFGKYVTLNLNSGIEFQRIKVDEKIRKRTQEVLSHNTDNYLNTGFRAGIAPGIKISDALSLETGINYSSIEGTSKNPRKNWYAGLMARIHIK